MTALLSSAVTYAQETCVADAVKLYFTTNAGWTSSEWYPIINIDAELLTPETSGIVAHTGANGTATSTAFSTGTFTTPIYNIDAQLNPVATAVKWPVKFYMSCLAKDFYNSAYTKVNETGANPSGNGVADAPCYFNNNSVKPSPIWNKKGFIELSRMASEVSNTPPSRHGYIEIDDLPQVERVQWSFSSTAWKRGVKLDIKYNDGPWQPLHWEPSNVAASLVGLAEQGYGFEEIIGKQEDPTSKISLRWRIWEGDSIHANLTKTDGSTYSTKDPAVYGNYQYGQQQVARIHQIKIFSGVVPETAPNAIKDNKVYPISIYKSSEKIILSEPAQVSVISIDGKLVYNGFCKEINMKDFSKGVYAIRATSEDGRTKTQKIVL
jgi:hypothetical protein